jgi:VIT1/CCC1 family predicted Fe2+/Mn2+ transporter
MDKNTHRELDLRDIILGGQDGLVNVLGIVLGVAAVAYTSSVVKFHKVSDALIVGVSAILGLLIPLAPFAIFPISLGMRVAVCISAGFLFVLGIYKARVTGSSVWRSGLEITIIGLTAAAIGYAVGLIFKIPTV